MNAPFPTQPGGEADVIGLIEQQFEQLERRFIRLKADARQAMQLTAVGSAATIWAHEFNNLLTAVLNHARIARERNDPEYTNKALDVIIHNAETMVVVSERILNLAARNESPQPKVVPLAGAVNTALESIGRNPQRDRIQVNVNVPPNLSAWIDPHSLHQILFNLLLNARRALMEKNGGKLVISAEPADERIVLSISDTGVGMSADQIEHAFDRFRSARPAVSDERLLRCGGIGLSLCRELIEESDGSICIESKPGQGTTFRLQLPAPPG